MPTTSDSRSLTLSQREMENLQDQEMRTSKPRQTLLSHLLDGPICRENQNQNNKEIDIAPNSEVILFQGLKHTFKTSETRRWPNLRLFTRSYKLSNKQTLMNMSDEQPLMNTPLKLISLTRSNIVQNNVENMQHKLARAGDEQASVRDSDRDKH